MRFYILLIFSFFLFSCQKEEITQTTEKQSITLVYMIADNDLSSFAIKDIKEMESGISPTAQEKMLVYVDTHFSAGLPSHPVLLEIRHDTSAEIKSKILYAYPEQNSADPSVFEQVLKDAFSFYGEEVKTKGLILWSHANAWLPNDYEIENGRNGTQNPHTQPLFKSFGKDNNPKNSAMEITDLAHSLKPYHFDYLLFDACFMASVEVLYELRHAADFFIASPTEILADGFPYHQILPYLIGNQNLEKVVEIFFEYYAQQKGVQQSASISLIEAKYMEDLAFFCKNFNFSKEIKKSDLQQYSRNNENYLFDLKQILRTQNISNTTLQNLWKKLCKTQKNTPFLANLPLENCNGLSVFLFNKDEVLNEKYKNLSWYKDTAWNIYF